MAGRQKRATFFDTHTPCCLAAGCYGRLGGGVRAITCSQQQRAAVARAVKDYCERIAGLRHASVTVE